MNVITIVPYSSSPLRERALEQVLTHLGSSPWPYWIAADHRKPFRLAQTVNRAIRRATADILILHAADTITPYRQMEVAVELAAAEPGMVFAYTDYVRLTEDGRRGQVLKEPPAHACMAIRKECWDELGGYDEAYIGWGMEDRDFNRRAEELWPSRRVPGELVHFWHGDRRSDDSDLDTPAEVVAENWRRFKATA